MRAQVYNHLAQEQDQHLDEINQIAARLKYDGRNINAQLQRQQGVMAELDGQIDQTIGRLTGLNAQVGQLLQTHDVNQICACMMLCCLMIVMIILILVF